jgi:hypothetical protein
VSVADDLGGHTVVSRWSASGRELEIEIAAAGREGHDVALALWTKLTGGQQKAYWLLVDAELRAGTPGEIDEDALRQKKALLSDRVASVRREPTNRPRSGNLGEWKANLRLNFLNLSA